ncbi:MAG: urease accessory protein UreE [Rhodobacteraceae bacterium]|nr:urease accessory protein UreE [Paracoccaceae bacterium]
MIKIVKRIKSGTPAGQITLPLELRVKARLKHRLDDGREAGIFLDRGPIMRDGDLLAAQDGSVIKVVAAPEEVSVVQTNNAHLFARACYHLGNRHVPLQILNNELRYHHDTVLDDLMVKLGLLPKPMVCPFEPEPGAYGDHGSDHDLNPSHHFHAH